MNETKKKLALDSISDLVKNFAYYDRKEDEELSCKDMNDLVTSGELTRGEIVDAFTVAVDEWLGEGDRMTIDIDQMEAGPEMDALMAERVMELKVWHSPEEFLAEVAKGIGRYPDFDWNLLWRMPLVEYKPRRLGLPRPYSSTWDAAGKVMEKLCITVRPTGDTWWAAVMHGNDPGMWIPAPTGPLAVCRAAYKAMESGK